METLTPPVEATEPTTTTEVVTPEAPAVGLHEMTRPERDQFLRDGKAPTREPKFSDDDADSSTAPAEGKKAAETAAKEKPAASETATPAKDKKARNSEENRVSELLEDRKRERERADLVARENRELRTRLDALERGSKSDGKTDSSTKEQPSEPSWKKTAADKAFPKISDFESPDEWAAAVTEYTRAQIESGLSAKETQSAEEMQVRQTAERAFSKGAAEVEADPTILDRIHPELEALPGSRAVRATGGEPNINHHIKDQVLLESERPLGLLAFYSTPDGQREWHAMRGMDERGIVRTIIAREHQLGASVTPGEATAKGDKKPMAKTFTKAPNPPEKEGPKGAQATDGAESAVKTGDFAEFERKMDAQGDGLTRRFGRRRG